jgi:hypothetical protein
MSDDKSIRGNPDLRQIDVNDSNELHFWAKSFGVTEEDLKSAVRQVGPLADRVRQYLNR